MREEEVEPETENLMRYDDLEAFVKPLLRRFRFLGPRGGKGETRNHRHLEDFLFKELRQVVGRARLASPRGCRS